MANKQSAETSSPSPAAQNLKRQSLPTGLGQKIVNKPRYGKRKRDETDANPERSTPQPSKRTHKRSTTTGTSAMSAPPHEFSRSSNRFTGGNFKLDNNSLLSDNITRQARLLAPNTRSDTTRTDYFRLKAMGIDPDIPIVPLGSRQIEPEAKDTQQLTDAAKISTQHASARPTTRISSSKPVDNLGPSPTQGPPIAFPEDGDDDEMLFASIRNVRESMAETTSWFKSEREIFESNMAPKTSISLPNVEVSEKPAETSAERRLREIKERGPTPSRARMRLQASGDNPLLPEGFWDGAGMGLSLHGRSKAEKRAPSPKPVRMSPQTASMGFAALGAQRFSGLMVNGVFSCQSDDNDDAQKQGASVEDAIEL